MGSSKLDLSLGRSYLGSWALQTALSSKLKRIIVVANPEGDSWLKPFEEKEDSLRIVWCPFSHLGQSESLKCGLQYMNSDEQSFMILLADQPFITKSMIDLLVDTYQQDSRVKPIDFVASRFQDVPRPPVIFNSSLLPFFELLEGDIGARKFLQASGPYRGKYIDFDDPWLFTDIDTPADYQMALKHLNN